MKKRQKKQNKKTRIQELEMLELENKTASGICNWFDPEPGAPAGSEC